MVHLYHTMREGKRLAKLLEKKEIGICECASKLSVNRLTVRRWINGVSEPTPLARRALKEILGFEWRGGRR